jgi:hypothetical protein
MEWTKVSEKLPTIGEEVIVWDTGGQTWEIATLEKGHAGDLSPKGQELIWQVNDEEGYTLRNFSDISYWMPCPTKIEEETFLTSGSTKSDV